MAVRFPRYARVVLLLCAVALAACGDRSANPSSPSAMGPVQSAVTAEPEAVQPEFLPTGSCSAARPFGVRLRIILTSRGDLILRTLRFQLTDASGASAFPEVIPIPSGQEAALPAHLAMPLPGAASLPPSAIPIPGAAPMTGVHVPGGTSHRLPFFLRFACGTIPDGTLLVTTDVTDRGRNRTSQLRVRVGR